MHRVKGGVGVIPHKYPTEATRCDFSTLLKTSFGVQWLAVRKENKDFRDMDF